MLSEVFSRFCPSFQTFLPVRGVSAFDSGPTTCVSTFFHTFDVPGTYYVMSEGVDRKIGRVNVLAEGMDMTSSFWFFFIVYWFFLSLSMPFISRKQLLASLARLFSRHFRSGGQCVHLICIISLRNLLAFLANV